MYAVVNGAFLLYHMVVVFLFVIAFDHAMTTAALVQTLFWSVPTALVLGALPSVLGLLFSKHPGDDLVTALRSLVRPLVVVYLCYVPLYFVVFAIAYVLSSAGI